MNPHQPTTCAGENLLDPHQYTSPDQLFEAEKKGTNSNNHKRTTVSCREYYCYKLQIRPSDKSMLLHIGRLLQQFVVDMYIKIESSRLAFHRNEEYQHKFRTELYEGLLDSLSRGEASSSNVGKRIILPASFIGSPRDMRRRYMDAMTLVQRYGKPDIFLTMTCNQNWPEIRKELGSTDTIDNRLDLVSRIFRAKLELLKHEVIKKQIFGKVAAHTYVIEFQKRGLSHTHFLIILKQGSKVYSPDAYDRIVSVELPDPQQQKHLYSLVVKHMLHGPCGIMNPQCHCMREHIGCKDRYPKDFTELTIHGQNSYPIYHRSNNGRKVFIRGHQLDNRWVLSSTERSQIIDEISNYQAARWVSPPEAMWRIFVFDLNVLYPLVMKLQNARELWLKYEDYLSEDIKLNKSLSQEAAQFKVLQQIDKYLLLMGKSLGDFHLTDISLQTFTLERETIEIEAERNIIVSKEDLSTIDQLNQEQKIAYHKILSSVYDTTSTAFFVDGPGGTGKTFLYRALLAKIRSLKHIALATATSGVAASILLGGRTAHSRVKIPLNDDEGKTCNISKQSSIAQLIKDAKLIIWDEATMAKRKAIERFDQLLQDIMSNKEVFSGKTVIFGGDFRQTLPVIVKGKKMI
ncbi:uncharacterized protein [Coffea arabica]|uniref:ATP-dependent DNA helicase n=1 Tax=Coffea arabica TaxID=13443 RepID=A0ABM4W3J8_COFAR